ncbi:T9SS type B sorting domain-containing protein [Flavobacterium caseinilyticum]|nr:T9SS type B sorting domain-containing protein [Flavobacterium caseinilyticum]
MANGGSIITGVVNNNTPYIYSVGQGQDTQLFTPKTNIGIVTNKGYIVEAEDLIYVSVRVNAGYSSVSRSYNHAGGLVSKGNSALGKEFRLGAMQNPVYDPIVVNFASVLSTENGTKVTFSNIPPGTVLTDGTIINGPIEVTLNKNESYVLALENYSGTVSNSSNIIGALVESDKPVVVNSGSFGGSNSTFVNAAGNPTGRDVGFDQIVPVEKTGKEYIFVKGLGSDELERVLLIANADDTKVFLNGSLTPLVTLSKGKNTVIDGSQFINGNLYVSTSENVSAYQSIGGDFSPANQNLFFVPPLNCSTPSIVDNIPAIESIGNTIYNGGLNIVTEAGAAVTLNNIPITSLPVAVVGNPNYVRYTVYNLSGNIAVKSTRQVYVSYFGTNGAATYGGYYSGFDTKPEIVTDKIAVATSACIPNVILKISTLSSYDTFQWYFNNILITGANSNSYTPTKPGFYQVKGSIVGCPSNVPTFSDMIPVSDCPLDSDNDGTNNNIDIDLDNDGILNILEANVSLLNQSNSSASPYYSATTSGSGTITGKPVNGYVSEVPAGKINNVSHTISFTKNKSISIQYIGQDNPTQSTPISEYLNSEGDFILQVPADKTITLTDPDNQLLVDTNYDGIYESGVTEFSSFQIRFRLKSTTPLAAGLGTFQFSSYLTNAVTFIHTNLSETAINKATFMISHTETFDSDSDTIPDLLDIDSDNDGIPDTIEAQGKGFKVYSGIDSNKDGLDDAFELGLSRINTDNDIFNSSPVYDYLDLDSDNDGIFDVVESGHNALDTNKDGMIDGPAAAFGSNGLFDGLETSQDSGKLNYTIADTNADGIFNYIDLDSDGDTCLDVIEAGFNDPDLDGVLGNSPVIVNVNGKVTSGVGYSTPNNNYITAAPIEITVQPQISPTCELENASIAISDNGGNTYQWQVSTDGVVWNTLSNNALYGGVTTKTLLITSIKNTMNGYKYRVKLEKSGNSCGLVSAETELKIYALPIVNTITIVQCDDDTDGFSDFNLTVKNSLISSDSAAEKFTYYSSLAGAQTAESSKLITNPLAFRNTTAGSMPVWSRVENANGCFSTVQINLVVSTTQIPASYKRTFSNCDDLTVTNDDTDGIATFDFSSVTMEILAILPTSTSGYSIKYYKNEQDALAENDAITNITNYSNVGYPNEQKIWVRVESTTDNACYGLSPRITLTVNPKPNIDTNEDLDENQLVCTNLPTFFVQLDSGIQDGSPSSNYTYIWSKDNVVLSGETKSTLDVNQAGNYTVEVSSLAGCSRTRSIKVTASDIAQITNVAIVDLSEVNSITVNVSGQGQYEYSLDAAFGPFQQSNLFENVSAGIHEVYINDKNGCGTVSQTVAVIGVPRFFTPNGDGQNDYWNVKGVNANFNENSIIYIYDRYGKLLKQISTSSQGWDGTFAGQNLPSDDYWYTIKLGDGREAKGHFSLKR